MLVVDSSVWIDFFADRSTAASEELERLLYDGRTRLVVPDLVLYEVLRGFRHERPMRQARQVLGGPKDRNAANHLTRSRRSAVNRPACSLRSAVSPPARGHRSAAAQGETDQSLAGAPIARADSTIPAAAGDPTAGLGIPAGDAGLRSHHLKESSVTG